jgi:hypothetical protein
METTMWISPFLAGLAAITLISLGSRASAELSLPDGPNRDFVARTCSACHDLGMVISARRSRDGWNATLDDMVSFGMNVSAQDRGRILDYLATYLPARE